MAQQWPTTAPTVSPGTHDPVATQAYQAGGGDYFRSGYYSHGAFSVGVFASLALTLNQFVLRPFPVPVRRSFDRIGMRVQVAGTTGAVVRLGLYNPGAGAPGSLRVDAGTVAATTTGAKEVTITQTLDPGVYWLGMVAQVVTCTVGAYPSNLVTPYYHPESLPMSSLGNSSAVIANAAVSGALPSTVAFDEGTGTNTPILLLRAA